VNPNRFTRRLARLHSLRYISLSVIIIGSLAISSSSVCLAQAFLPSVLPTCFSATGTITQISGNQLQITLQQGSPIVDTQFSNATQFLKEDIADSSALREGINIQVQARGASAIAETVLLYSSEQPLGCRQMSQSVSNTPPSSTSASLSSEPLVTSQGIVQQVTDSAFTILPRTGQLKTFVWTKNTTFLQYTNYQSSQILSPGQPILLIGPARNGAIMASRIVVLPQAQMKGKRSCFGSRSNVVCDLAALALLAVVF
jgi:hypothetical protein